MQKYTAKITTNWFFFSDVPGSVVDLIIDLAYSGWVGGLALNNISQVILIGFTKKRIKTIFFPR